MKSRFNLENIILVAAILIAALAFNKKLNRSTPSLIAKDSAPARPVANATPKETKTDPVQASNSSVLRSVPTASTEKSQESSNANTNLDLDLCREFKDRKVFVSRKFLKSTLTQRTAALLAPEETLQCLSKGTSAIVLKFSDFNYQEPIPFFTTLESTALVSEVEKGLELSKVLSDPEKLRKSGLENSTEGKKTLLEIFGPDSLEKKWIYVTLSVGEKNLNSKTFFAPKQHPFAQTVTKESVDALVSQGPAIFDFRKYYEFQKKHFEKAMNIPLSNDDVNDKVMSVAEQKIVGFFIHKEWMPADLETKVLVVNDNPKSFSAYNAVTYLHSLGYKNIYFYWAGMDEWMNHSLVLPETAPAGKYISYSELKEKLTNPMSLVIDVRSKKNQKKIPFTRGTSLSFKQKSEEGEKQPLYRAESLTASFLESHGEKFAEPFPEDNGKFDNVVIIGDHTYDWKAVKAAVALPEKWWNKTFIYRDGIKGLKFLSGLDNDPSLPKIKKISKKSLHSGKLSASEKAYRKAMKRAGMVFDAKEKKYVRKPVDPNKLAQKAKAKPPLTPSQLAKAAAHGPDLKAVKGTATAPKLPQPVSTPKGY